MAEKWWLMEGGPSRDEARRASNTGKKDLLDRRLYIFDQDGTLYLGERVLPGSRELVSRLLDTGKDVIFLSNNSSKSAGTYREKLARILGIEIPMESIYTSTLATVQYLRSLGVTRVYPLGTPDFEREMTDHGFVLTDEDPELVLLAFDMTLTYEKLQKACGFIQNGLEYVATHPDRTCPTEEGPIPDIGSFMALIETATGAKAKKVVGKPNPEMVRFLLEKHGLGPGDAVIFGDRLYTDMRMGKDSGIATALMLTGEARVEDIEGYGLVPDFVFEDMEEVLGLLKG